MKVKGLSQLFSQLANSESSRVSQESVPQTGAIQQEAVKFEPQRTTKEQSRIDELKAKVASGEYKVDSTKVAKAIVDFYKSA
jgi:anti-sigma28 factor (negative regulator of flagellin synthesis)